MYNKLKKKIYNFLHPKLGEILMLHQVSVVRTSDTDRYDLEITPEFLEQTILKYRDSGYRFASLDEIHTQLTENKHYKKKFVAFTFDDGYANNFLLAYPIFKKYNCPFAIYVSGDKTKNDDETALTPEQIKILAKEPLCTVGGHTVSHLHLAELDYNTQYQEIEENKRQLEILTGKDIFHFSFPFGSYNQDTLKILKQLEFKTSTRNLGDRVRKGDSLLELYRRNIVEP
jgi:peptidoglycan/xylan/chitin deacetylase (PgdA/CDA1 family)